MPDLSLFKDCTKHSQKATGKIHCIENVVLSCLAATSLLMLVHLHLVGGQAIMGDRHLQTQPSRLLLNHGMQGRSSTLPKNISNGVFNIRTEHEEIERRCIGKLLTGRIKRHLNCYRPEFPHDLQ